MLGTPPDSMPVKGTALTATVGAGSRIQSKLLFMSAGTGTESSGLRLQIGKFWLFLRKNSTALELVKWSSRLLGDPKETPPWEGFEKRSDWHLSEQVLVEILPWSRGCSGSPPGPWQTYFLWICLRVFSWPFLWLCEMSRSLLLLISA